MLVRMTNQFHKHGRKETHYAFTENCDMAICGCDLIGDSDISGDYSGVGQTPHRKVNCSDCLNLYKEIVEDFKLKRN